MKDSDKNQKHFADFLHFLNKSAKLNSFAGIFELQRNQESHLCPGSMFIFLSIAYTNYKDIIQSLDLNFTIRANPIV